MPLLAAKVSLRKSAMKVYFIPGLGADKRVFKNIELPGGYEMVNIDWLEPAKEESLPHYAQRLANSINPAEPFVMVGLSFGGMLTAEISRLFKPAKTILISSLPSPKNLPPYFKILAPLKLQNIIPISLFKNASLVKRLFTTETREDKDLLRKIISETDPHFIRWALGAILTWDGPETHGKFYHIHGSADKLLPVRFVHPTHIIKGGGHLMVMNRAAEVNRILEMILGEQ
jgi:pimeloyl-ACP methyl ester carboxylesterase